MYCLQVKSGLHVTLWHRHNAAVVNLHNFFFMLIYMSLLLADQC
jgi:hypothetical protein